MPSNDANLTKETSVAPNQFLPSSPPRPTAHPHHQQELGFRNTFPSLRPLRVYRPPHNHGKCQAEYNLIAFCSPLLETWCCGSPCIRNRIEKAWKLLPHPCPVRLSSESSPSLYNSSLSLTAQGDQTRDECRNIEDATRRSRDRPQIVVTFSVYAKARTPHTLPLHGETDELNRKNRPI